METSERAFFVMLSAEAVASSVRRRRSGLAMVRVILFVVNNLVLALAKKVGESANPTSNF